MVYRGRSIAERWVSRLDGMMVDGNGRMALNGFALYSRVASNKYVVEKEVKDAFLAFTTCIFLAVLARVGTRLASAHG